MHSRTDNRVIVLFLSFISNNEFTFHPACCSAVALIRVISFIVKAGKAQIYGETNRNISLLVHQYCEMHSVLRD